MIWYDDFTFFIETSQYGINPDSLMKGHNIHGNNFWIKLDISIPLEVDGRMQDFKWDTRERMKLVVHSKVGQGFVLQLGLNSCK